MSTTTARAERMRERRALILENPTDDPYYNPYLVAFQTSRANRHASPPRRLGTVTIDSDSDSDSDMIIVTPLESLRPPQGQPRPTPVDIAEPPPAGRAINALVNAPDPSPSRSLVKPPDPFNQGFRRPAPTTNGFVKLNNALLSNQVATGFLKSKHLSGVIFAKGATATQKVYAAWDIGNVSDNYFDFKRTMLTSSEGPRVAWVFHPSSIGLADMDYRALQLVLSEIPGVQEADDLRPNVNAIFVHVSEIDHIGAGPNGKLAKLDAFRSQSDGDMVYIVFGTRVTTRGGQPGGAKEYESYFLSFWTIAATITFTPQAYFDEPKLVMELLQKSTQRSHARLRRGIIYPWAPSLYYALGGPFYLPPGVDDDVHKTLDDAETGPGIRAFHRAARDKLLKLVGPVPSSVPDRRVKVFPHGSDEYRFTAQANEFLIGGIAETADSALVAKFMDCTTVRSLEAMSAAFSKRYLQIRRWIVIGTDQELTAANSDSRIPGIDRMTIAQAKRFLSNSSTY